MTALQTNRREAPPGRAPAAAAAAPSLARAWYSVGVLFAVYILSFVDRQMVNLLVEPISSKPKTR